MYNNEKLRELTADWNILNINATKGSHPLFFTAIITCFVYTDAADGEFRFSVYQQPTTNRSSAWAQEPIRHEPAKPVVHHQPIPAGTEWELCYP